ncbi:gluconokinase [Daeguia caeni]|uniref:Gluconokinase n=1 Tax=Daeguia caeni TaxID=439612 RepID=A0ABV9H731_9HYPH
MRDQAPRIIVMGVSGSGKSTIGALLATRLALPFVEGDGLHPADNIARMRAGIALQDEDRWPWFDRVAEQLALAEQGVVISCSALKKAYRDYLREKAGAALHFVFLDTASVDLPSRLQGRTGHFMPVSLIESQLATLEAPENEDLVLTVDAAAKPDTIMAACINWLSKGGGMQWPQKSSKNHYKLFK